MPSPFPGELILTINPPTLLSFSAFWSSSFNRESRGTSSLKIDPLSFAVSDRNPDTSTSRIFGLSLAFKYFFLQWLWCDVKGDVDEGAPRDKKTRQCDKQ